ncbi:MAG: transposase [Ruminococcus sp.]|nr:transposase [Ruminococcus sp.]
MLPDTLCKIVHQYNKNPVLEEDMEKLLAIADDYRVVKNYVYDRYGGIGSLWKIYPGYTVQNELTQSGLRTELGLPSVYFYLAIFDALGDIKSQWTKTKSKIMKHVGKNENFTVQEKHYLRFLLKVNNAFEAVLNQKAVLLAKNLQPKYEELVKDVDTGKMHRYLCRQVRKYHRRQHTDRAEGFSLSERAYRYGDHGIYISAKERRKRIFIVLTDNNQYKRQIYLKLYPKQHNIEIDIPVNVSVKRHDDYINSIGVAMGMYTMLTTHEGNQYGEKLGKYQAEYAEWMRIQTGIYQQNRNNNPGRKKYNARKNRYREQMHSYINQELNRFLRTEKPQKIYLPKLPKPKARGGNHKSRNFATMWQRGYIRGRLEQKCQEQSIQIVEVLGKDISNECSWCGKAGIKQERIFTCPFCRYSSEERMNAARNAKKRGEDFSKVRS